MNVIVASHLLPLSIGPPEAPNRASPATRVAASASVSNDEPKSPQFQARFGKRHFHRQDCVLVKTGIVLRLGRRKNGNVRVSVLPERDIPQFRDGQGFSEIRRGLRFLDERLGMLRRAHRQETGRIAFALRAIPRLQSRIEYE